MSKLISPCTQVLNFTEEDVKNICETFERNWKDVEDDVEIVKKWYMNQPHLPKIFDGNQILRLLVLNKFSIEKTKEKIDLTFTMKSLMNQYYGFDPKSQLVETLTKSVLYAPFPNLYKGQRIILWKVLNADLFDPTGYITFMLMSYLVRFKNDFWSSDIYIIDFSGINATFLTRLGLVDLKNIFYIIEKMLSNRVSAMHFIKPSSFAETIISMVKTVVKEKLANRIKVNKNFDEMLEIFGADFLPSDFGGNAKSSEHYHADWLAHLNSEKDYLDSLKNAECDESLRPEKLKNDELLGYHGNFKKLNLD